MPDKLLSSDALFALLASLRLIRWCRESRLSLPTIAHDTMGREIC